MSDQKPPATDSVDAAPEETERPPIFYTCTEQLRSLKPHEGHLIQQDFNCCGCGGVIVGKRYRCNDCRETYDFGEPCYTNRCVHPPGHTVRLIEKPWKLRPRTNLTRTAEFLHALAGHLELPTSDAWHDVDWAEAIQEEKRVRDFLLRVGDRMFAGEDVLANE